MSLIYIKGTIKDATKASITLHLWPRITCADSRNLIAFISVTLSHTNTPALFIATDTKVREKEHINKVQSVPLFSLFLSLSLWYRGEKRNLSFSFSCFCFLFFSETSHLFYEAVSCRWNNITMQLTTNNWQAEPVPQLCTGHRKQMVGRRFSQ